MADVKMVNMPDLPILKHLDIPTEGEARVTNWAAWKKGEKPIGFVVGMLLLAGAAYALFVYVLPVVLRVLSETLAAIAAFLTIAFFVMASPLIYKLFRRIIRGIHKALIVSDPFAELEDQLGKMRNSRREFESAKNEINACKVQMKQAAVKAEKDAKIAQDRALECKKEAEILKQKLDGLVAQKGDAIKETDDFVTLENRLTTILGDGNRAVSEAQTHASLVDTFASRANIFAKLDRKLLNYGHAFDEKIKDFEMSIRNLKTVAQGMASANNATTRARNVLNNNNMGWEFDYAMEVITNKISADIASTQSNIRDLDSIVRDFNPNDERAYARLENFSNGIKEGTITVSDANRVSNPNFNLTPDQKNASGGLSDVFN
jgi:hypothetical protein